MPGLDSIIGQQLPVSLLANYLRNSTTPHALLFSGMDGVGKRTTATAMAMSLNCRQRNASPVEKDEDNATADFDTACGRCRRCRQIQAGQHPDVIRIEPTGRVIKIEQIRTLLHQLALKPFEADCRVVIIAGAHTMNPEAGNALLKVLEEPPSQTIIILTAPQQTDLLPTIVSRCQHIRFKPLAKDDLVHLLTQPGGLDAERAAQLARMAGGSLTRAMQLDGAAWVERAHHLIQAAGLARPPATAFNTASLALSWAEALSRSKDEVQNILALMSIWVRDLIISRWAPDLIIFSDHRDLMVHTGAALSTRMLLDRFDALANAQKAIAANANLRLTLDVLALEMAGLINHEPEVKAA